MIFVGIYVYIYEKGDCGTSCLLSSNNQQSIKAVHRGNLG